MRRALLVAATESPVRTHDHADDIRADVEALGSALTDAAFDEIRALDDPGRTRMLEELRSFCAVAEPTDVLVVALHGTIVRGGDGRLYFPAASGGRRIAHGAVRLDAVSEIVQTCPARSTVVLLDCDYSGWFDDGPDGLTPTAPQFDLRRAFPGDGCAVFAAPGGGGHGPDSLSRGVARALRGAAPDRDGDDWIDTADLEEYLRRTRTGTRPPVLVTDAPPAPLACRPHRTFDPLPSAHPSPATRPDPRSLLADLTAVEDLDVARFGDTALASLTHTPEPGRAEASIPVSTAEVSEAHHWAVESAMARRLTVVAAPPGNGAGTLATATAHTAVASGQSVLFVTTDTDAADAFTVDVRTEAATAHLAVRADVSGPSRTAHRGSGPFRNRRAGTEDGEAAARAALYRDWAAVCVARSAIDAIARIERDLTLLAEARGQIIAAGWDPRALFRGKPPREWLRLGEQATGRLSLRPLRRSAARRRLASAADSTVLDRVCQIARVEQEWATALDTRRRATSLEELYADLVTALEAHRWSSAAYLAARSEPGRHATARAEPPEPVRTGPGADRLPVWAVGVGQAGELPMRAGLFDLVIVDGADRYGVHEVLPLLYRARRALVIGDPAATAFTADTDGRRCGEPPVSAYRALARVRTETGGQVLWLDEHDRSHPEIATLADRCCYGGRGTVLTDPRTLPGDAARPVQWHDVRGAYEPDTADSFVNREEAHRTAAVLTALDVRLPEGATVGVTSPFHGQRALLRRLTGRRRYSRAIRIEAPHGFGARPCDALVVSPVLSGPNPHRTVARTLAGPQWWHPLLTGAVAQFVVVGDRRFWQEGAGVPAALAEAASARPGAAEVPRPLVQALGDLSARVELGPLAGGHRVDLRVRTPDGPVLVLVDRTRDGRGLRRLLDRRQRLQETTGLPVLRVPFWRCLHDPEDLAKEILLGRA